MRRAPLPLLLAVTLAATSFGCESPPPPSGSAAAPQSAAPAPIPVPARSNLAPLSASGMADLPASSATPQAPPEVVAAQHLLVAYKGAKGAAKTITRSKADAKKRAEEALAKAKKGDDFAALVKTYSDEPGAADRQGSLGKFKHDAMVKPFADAAFALKVGEISDVVESDFGFHVIKRNQ